MLDISCDSEERQCTLPGRGTKLGALIFSRTTSEGGVETSGAETRAQKQAADHPGQFTGFLHGYPTLTTIYICEYPRQWMILCPSLLRLYVPTRSSLAASSSHRSRRIFASNLRSPSPLPAHLFRKMSTVDQVGAQAQEKPALSALQDPRSTPAPPLDKGVEEPEKPFELDEVAKSLYVYRPAPLKKNQKTDGALEGIAPPRVV